MIVWGSLIHQQKERDRLGRFYGLFPFLNWEFNQCRWDTDISMTPPSRVTEQTKGDRLDLRCSQRPTGIKKKTQRVVGHLGAKQTLGQLDLTDGQSTELLTLGGKQSSESCSQEPTRLPGNMA